MRKEPNNKPSAWDRSENEKKKKETININHNSRKKNMMWNNDADTDYNTNYKKKMCRVLKKVVLRVSGAKESPKETGKQS